MFVAVFGPECRKTSLQIPKTTRSILVIFRLFDLLSVFRTVLNRYDNENPPPLIFRGESYSVRGQVDRLLSRLDTSRPLDLVDDLLALSCRSEAIASFLAILELTRMELMRLHQTEGGGVLMYRTTREISLEELETISQ